MTRPSLRATIREVEDQVSIAQAGAGSCVRKQTRLLPPSCAQSVQLTVSAFANRDRTVLTGSVANGGYEQRDNLINGENGACGTRAE